MKDYTVEDYQNVLKYAYDRVRLLRVQYDTKQKNGFTKIPTSVIEERTGEIKESLDKLQHLVDQATPKKPTTKINSFDYYCPICHVYILSKQSYCMKCGQALDWSDSK